MEPQMAGAGFLSTAFGWITGHDAGAGMAVIMVVFGLMTIIVMLSGFANPLVRNLEDVLPDHDQAESCPEVLNPEFAE
jgi:hypothetical protein